MFGGRELELLLGELLFLVELLGLGVEFLFFLFLRNL